MLGIFLALILFIVALCFFSYSTFKLVTKGKPDNPATIVGWVVHVIAWIILATV